MRSRFDDNAEIGGRDPLDTRVGQVPAATAAPPDTWLRRLTRRLQTRAAFGLAPVLAPAMLFVPLGYLLGPARLNLLPTRALDHLDPVISVGLATLGVFVGLALGRRPRWDTRLFLAASFEAIVTVLIVGGAILYLLYSWHLPLQTSTVAIALALGVSASASSASATSGFAPSASSAAPASAATAPDHDTAHAIASRVADLDDVLPIVVGALAIALLSEPGRSGQALGGQTLDGQALGEQTLGALALGVRALDVHSHSPWLSLGLVGVTMLVGLAVGIAGWLLIERAHSVAERGLFVLGLLALVGGASAYLSLSPLLAGLTAGMFWNWSPGRTDVIVREDISKFQHPLAVLILIAAGANLELSMAALWLFAPFVLFRIAGKLAGGWLASRLTPGLASADLGAHLLAPGLLGIAFALNLHQHLATTDAAAVLTAVVIGTLASEGVAWLVAPAEGDA
jgi:hypothetical protein